MPEAIHITLPIKPLSINAAFQGRRFKTKAANQYDKTLQMLLPHKDHGIKSEYYSVFYNFYLKNFAMTDADNLIKVLQDNLVKKGLISDDRKICEYSIKKFKADEDKIEISIYPFPHEDQRT